MKKTPENQQYRESYPDAFAYTLREWDEKMTPQIGDDKRFKPQRELDQGQFRYIKDTETGDVFRYNFQDQQGSTTGELHGGIPVGHANERWVNCVKEK